LGDDLRVKFDGHGKHPDTLDRLVSTIFFRSTSMPFSFSNASISIDVTEPKSFPLSPTAFVNVQESALIPRRLFPDSSSSSHAGLNLAFSDAPAS